MFRQSYGFDKTFSLPTVGKLMEPKIEFNLIYIDLLTIVLKMTFQDITPSSALEIKEYNPG